MEPEITLDPIDNDLFIFQPIKFMEISIAPTVSDDGGNTAPDGGEGNITIYADIAVEGFNFQYIDPNNHIEINWHVDFPAAADLANQEFNKYAEYEINGPVNTDETSPHFLWPLDSY